MPLLDDPFFLRGRSAVVPGAGITANAPPSTVGDEELRCGEIRDRAVIRPNGGTSMQW